MGGGSTPKTTKKLTPSVVERLRFVAPATEPLSLLVYHRDGAQLVQLRPDAGVVIGRAAPADVTINDVSLSRQHARFSFQSGEVVVEDLGSTNGTFVAGQPIERASLKSGDEVHLGAVTVTVHHHAKPGTPGLTGHERFRSLLEDEVVRAKFFGRPLSVVMVRVLEGSDRHVRFWSPRVQPLLRAVDRAAIYSPEMLEIVLPEASAEMALELARKILDADPSLGCGVATYPDAGTSGEELLGESRAAAQRASIERRIQSAGGQGARTLRPPPMGDASSQPVASSPAMTELLQTAARVAKGAIPVLINGETGTGKEVLSRFIHDKSPRQGEPIICVNCGAIPAQLVESTLFGHEKGAFTGAAQQQKGVFEAADGGTVFLDEIGELPAAAQAALLRVLEAKRFTRVGSTRELTVDVRVIAATHRDLTAMCDEGTFRRDLFYRLNTVTLKVPPLRDRLEDIEPLSYRLLEGANEANAGNIRFIDREALALMREYDWPGNVRELKNALERAVVIAEGDTITADDLPEAVRARRTEAIPSPPPSRATLPSIGSIELLEGDFRNRMERLEAEVLTDALRRAGWNQTEAARQLSMPLRTLVYKIRMHGIRKPTIETGPVPR